MTALSDQPLVKRRWVVATTPTDEFTAAPYPMRHATVADHPRRRQTFLTLAGEEVVSAEEVPGRPAPECRLCDRAWRAAEGIEQRDEHGVR